MLHERRVHEADAAERHLESLPRMLATWGTRQCDRVSLQRTRWIARISEAEAASPIRATVPRSAAGRSRPRRSLVLIIVAALGISLRISGAFAADGGARELLDLSLEQLANLQITSVSKKSERLADAPASVFVITAEDIRRSGATTLPEALRLAPNVEVARVDANQYAISARGFNSTSEIGRASWRVRV